MVPDRNLTKNPLRVQTKIWDSEIDIVLCTKKKTHVQNALNVQCQGSRFSLWSGEELSGKGRIQWSSSMSDVGRTKRL